MMKTETSFAVCRRIDGGELIPIAWHRGIKEARIHKSIVDKARNGKYFWSPNVIVKKTTTYKEVQ